METRMCKYCKKERVLEFSNKLNECISLVKAMNEFALKQNNEVKG